MLTVVPGFTPGLDLLATSQIVVSWPDPPGRWVRFGIAACWWRPAQLSVVPGSA